jgi:clan AA aspartic protease
VSLDTGFTGALVLPQSLIARLNLTIAGRQMFEMVGGRQFVAGVALAEVEWLGAAKTVRVIVSEDTLLGTELLDGTKLMIDYVAHTLTISGEES